MQLLDGGGEWRRDGHGLVTDVRQRVGRTARHRPGPHADVPGPPCRRDQVLAASRGRHQHQDVAPAAVCADLAGEHLLDPVVVDDRGQRGRLRVQGDCRKGGPVVAITPDHLGAQMLGLSSTSTVAGDQQPSAGRQGVGQVPPPALALLCGRSELGERRPQCIEVDRATTTSVGAGLCRRSGVGGQRLRHQRAPAVSVRSDIPVRSARPIRFAAVVPSGMVRGGRFGGLRGSVREARVRW